MKTFIFLFFLTINISGYAAVFQNLRLQNKIQTLPDGSKLKVSLQKIADSCSRTTELYKVVVSKNQKSSFDYFYEYNEIDAALPTVIYFPGGPGGFSIGSTLNIKNVNVIKIDPRGTGCNWGDDSFFTPNEVSTETVANDAIEVIKSRRLKNIVLYGQSYGTVLATYVAKKMEEMKTPPELVVLEGTVGQSWNDWRDYLDGFLKNGNIFLQKNSDIKLFLSQASLPLNLPSKFWAWRISLSSNSWENSVQDFKILQDPASHEYDEAKQDTLYNYQYFISNQSSDLTENPSFFVTQSVLCSELSKSYKSVWPFDLSNGDLVFNDIKYNNSFNYCPNGSIHQPYDSANFQMNSPIVYFQGNVDPQTSIDGALYHYHSQKNQSVKYFYKIENGGHSLLSQILAGCSDEIWKSLLSKEYNLNKTLDSSGHCR